MHARYALLLLALTGFACAGAAGADAVAISAPGAGAPAAPVAATSANAGATTDDPGAALAAAKPHPAARAQASAARPSAAHSHSPSPSPSPSPSSASAPSAPPPRDDRPRLTSQGYTTWIWPEPARKGSFLGYIRNGDSVALRATEPVRGAGCPGGFLPVEPRGWVCVDRTVALAPTAREVELSAATRAAPGAFPYRYALSNGAPMYNRIPTRAEQARFERKFGRAGSFLPLPKSLAAHEDLAVVEPIPSDGAMPPFLSGGQQVSADRLGLVRQDIPLGSMLSFTRAFEAEGRTWLLSADQTLVPADRVRPFRPSAFRGTRLGREVSLPIAWIRKEPRARYRPGAAGAMERAAGEFALRSFVRLTGARVERGGRAYLETRERDADGAALYIGEEDATVVEARKRLPSGVAEGQKWMHVRITQGTLVAYEGLTPVYATLMSPGAGGVSIPGRDPVKDSTTPRGTFYVTFKDRATTMSPEQGDNRAFWIADVPHTQYFNPPFALHAAYWHERFGEPTSAGCVNVSPIDAEALFQWSDPPVPPEWQGATGSGATKENGPTTAVVVHR